MSSCAAKTRYSQWLLASCYTVTTYIGRIDEVAKVIWKTQAPTNIHAFMWLLAKNAILTWYNLERKG